MHSRFRFYAVIALITLGNSLSAQDDGGVSPEAVGMPTPGKHQLRPTPIQVLQHLVVQQNQQITEQKEQITALAGKIGEQEKQIATLAEKLETSQAHFDTLGGQLIQITGLLEDIRKSIAAAPAAPTTGVAVTPPPRGTDPLDEPAEATAARAAATAQKPTEGEEPLEPGGQVHLVEAGETLTVIAQKYGTSVSELTKLNKIKDPKKLQVGQSLFIP